MGIVWLSILMQPCLMAMDHEQHNCPHCPPPIHEDCAGGGTIEDCGYLKGLDLDRRVSKTKFGEGSEDLQPALISTCELPQFALVSVAHGNFPKSAAAPPGPPLNVLFCVYLK
jgi:hypothetical protein